MVNKLGDKSWPTFHPRPSFKLGLWGKIHIYYVYYVYIFIIYIIFIYIYIYSLEINHCQHFTPDLVSNSDCEGNTSHRYFRCILRSKGNQMSNETRNNHGRKPSYSTHLQKQKIFHVCWVPARNFRVNCSNRNLTKNWIYDAERSWYFVWWFVCLSGTSVEQP